MSIVNGRLGKRNTLLAANNLLRNPFFKQEPPEDVIDRVFVGREEDLLDAAMRVYDGPRNLLIVGGYGSGKTTFIRKLFRELLAASSVRFIVGYSTLRHDSPEGFQLAALTALVEGMRTVAERGSELHQFATSTREELARLEPDSRGLRAPDLRFRDGLELARKAGFHRAVIAVDELDKRDAHIVQEVVMGARFLLDTDASFLLTGRYMDIFSDIRSSLMAAFDHRLELKPFTPEECREILKRNLAAARRTPEAEPTLAPFQQQVVESLINDSQGLPRPLNLMAYSALELAIREHLQGGSGTLQVTPAHLERVLQYEGNLIYNDVGERGREVLKRIYERKGYASGADLDALTPLGGIPEAMRELEQLARRDAVLRLEAGGEPAFALAPTVDRAFRQLQRQRQQLKELWQEALDEEDNVLAGRALERFAAAFFAECFTVQERNARTDTEEIDLVLQASSDTDPAFRKGSYLLVECKNRRKEPVNQEAVTKLAGILKNHNLSQGFLLASKSFTEDALRQAYNIAQSMQVEVVLIDGSRIETFLDDLRSVRDFLVDLHRRQILRLR